MKNGVCRPPSSFVSTYTDPVNFVCGVIDFGATTHIPRSRSSFSIPRSRIPMLSPAIASSIDLRNISTPVHTVDRVSPSPTISISGRGTVATGRMERGKVKVGDNVEIVGLKDTKKTVVTGIEMFRKVMDEAQAGDNIGILLRGIEKNDVERGQVICAPGSIQPHKKFKGQVYILTKEEGGRHTPFFNGYRPQFYVRTTDVTGSVKLKAGVEMVMPGDNVEVEVELMAPVALEKGVRFAIREGGHTVGAGVVTEILQ